MNPDLSQLRDIHLPEAVGWWPPAMGWWLLLAVAVGLVALIYLLRKRRGINRWRKEAAAELRRIKVGEESGLEVVQQLSILMRRVATTRFPEEDVASLSGREWAEFIEQKGCGRDAAKLLADAPYRDRAVTMAEAAALHKACGDWIAKLPGGEA